MSLIQLKNDIGGMTSLQTLRTVTLHEDGIVELIREIGKLNQLKQLGLIGARPEHGSVLSFSVNEMQHLEKLFIQFELAVDLVIPPPPMLQDLCLHGGLNKLPDWVSQLQNLVKLSLRFSELIDDPMKSLQNMPNLLALTLFDSYNGQSFHFEDGGFQKLKELYLEFLPTLNSIIIDKGALRSLKMLQLSDIPKLETIPFGIQHLEKYKATSFVTQGVKKSTLEIKVPGVQRNGISSSPCGLL